MSNVSNVLGPLRKQFLSNMQLKRETKVWVKILVLRYKQEVIYYVKQLSAFNE